MAKKVVKRSEIWIKKRAFVVGDFAAVDDYRDDEAEVVHVPSGLVVTFAFASSTPGTMALLEALNRTASKTRRNRGEDVRSWLERVHAGVSRLEASF